MLTFTRHPVKVSHINLRVEYHGDEQRTMADIDLTGFFAGEVLDQLSPTLRATLYEAQDGKPDLTHLRYPALGRLTWQCDHKGVTFVLHPGTDPDEDLYADDADDLIFVGARVHGLKLTPQEGGTIAVAERVQVELMDGLALMLGRTMQATLTAPPKSESFADEQDAQDDARTEESDHV
jgi:hypothetical protein